MGASHHEAAFTVKTYVCAGDENPKQRIELLARTCVNKSGRRDLNPRPLDPQSSALPSWATSRCADAHTRSGERAYPP